MSQWAVVGVLMGHAFDIFVHLFCRAAPPARKSSWPEQLIGELIDGLAVPIPNDGETGRILGGSLGAPTGNRGPPRGSLEGSFLLGEGGRWGRARIRNKARNLNAYPPEPSGTQRIPRSHSPSAPWGSQMTVGVIK